MARKRQIIETITCDACGRQTDDAATVTLGWGREQWELDLCATDNDKLSTQFDKWVENGRKIRTTRALRSPQAANADWDYLESLGFKRHRGRKTAEENAALAKRK
jgi:hypothetical protein